MPETVPTLPQADRVAAVWPPWPGPTVAEVLQLCGRLATSGDMRGAEIVGWMWNEHRKDLH
jgi:hypothetical protein